MGGTSQCCLGRATFPGSLDYLRPFGYFISFGTASGPLEPFDITLLEKKGPLFALWPIPFEDLARREDVPAMSEDLFRVVASEAVKIHVHTRLPLTEAPEHTGRLARRFCCHRLKGRNLGFRR